MHKIKSQAIEAMRKWSRHGSPGIVRSAELYQSGEISETDWKEMSACAESVDKLKRENPEIVEVVREVYMAGSSRGRLRKGDISSRVLHYCTHRYTSEREVYRMLTQASRTFDEYITLYGEGERRTFDE